MASQSPATERLDEQLEQKAARVRVLEKEADDMHKLAQRMNKEGRYEEAAKAYAAMHALEDEASVLAKEVGCVACVLGDPSCGAAEVVGPAEAAAYFTTLHAVPWCSSSQSDTEATMRGRVVGAVVGSLTADAAATGCHWVYDLDLMATLAHEAHDRRHSHDTAGPSSSGGNSSRISTAAAAVSQALGSPHLEFLNPPRSPYYNYAVGRNSPYGEQTLVLLRSVASAGGLDCVDYAHRFSAYFGEGFDGYRDVSTKGFLRNYGRGAAPPLTGAPDAQANAIARAAVLVAGWGGSSDTTSSVEVDRDQGLPAAVRRATRVTQNSDAAVAWALAGAGVMEALVTGRQLPSEAVVSVAREVETPGGRLYGGDEVLASDIAARLRQVATLAHLSPKDAIAQLGRNCHMPNALTSPLHIVLHIEHAAREALGATTAASGWDADVAAVMGACYTDGVRAAIAEGGCCASRAAFVGGCLGALASWTGAGGHSGVGVPASWVAQYSVGQEVVEAASAVCDGRTRAGLNKVHG